MEAAGARGASDLATSMSPMRNVNKKDICYVEYQHK